MRAKFNKLTAYIRDEGIGKLPGRVWQWLRTRVVDSGDTIWFARDVTSTEDLQSSDSFKLSEANTPELHAQLDALRPLDPEIQRLRESAGGIRWAVLDEDGEVAYTGWTFQDEAIVVERPPLTVPLPERRSFQLEDSYVPRAKRKSQASVLAVDILWTELFNRGGEFQMLTKIDAENIAAKKALGRGGWNEFAVVSATRWFSRFTRWNAKVSDPSRLPALETLGK